MSALSNKLKDFITSLFSQPSFTFSKVVIRRSVIENIIDFAKANYPKEFVALLKGKVKNNVLTVYGLTYQPFHGSRRSSHISMDLPIMSGVVGSVHSHPSRDSGPSLTDLRFFNKSGFVHLIINYPYNPKSIRCYDSKGEVLTFVVKENKQV